MRGARAVGVAVAVAVAVLPTLPRAVQPPRRAAGWGGAAGFLSKGIDPDRLVEALRGVLRGEAALARKRTMRVPDELRVLHDTPGRHVMELTDEECALVLRHRRDRHA